jgi:hypothetical protein
MNAIPNDRLTLGLLPADEADWLEILAFAQTFDGYEFWGSFERCAAFAEAKGHASLTGLRTCLFFEHRKWRNGDEHKPNSKTMQYWRSLVRKIRALVEKQAGEPSLR